MAALDVAVYQIREHHRSAVICSALMEGIRVAGDRPLRVWEDSYIAPLTDVAVFYGLEGKLPRVFDDHLESGRTAVYVDLGYFGRREGGRWTGYHKLSVGDRHPTEYFQRVRHAADRFQRFGLPVQPWRRGQHIVLAGMGDKGATAEGYKPEAWERAAIAEIRRHSTRPIVYRPKPSWKAARPIPGTIFSPRTQELDELLRGAHAVVTHHSNVAVDGLLAGVPAFAWKGVSVPMASQDLAEIERPRRPDGREQWLADIAYTQWSVAELASGAAWRHLKNEGLVP